MSNVKPIVLNYHIGTRRSGLPLLPTAKMFGLWAICGCFAWTSVSAAIKSIEASAPNIRWVNRTPPIKAPNTDQSQATFMIACFVFGGVAVVGGILAMRQYYMIAAIRRGQMIEPAFRLPESPPLPDFLRR